MTTQQAYDYIIVGQGIAGSMLAWHLLEHGKTLLVVDDARPDSGSRVAAGMFSPLTGKRVALGWRAAETLNYNALLYPRLEQEIGAKFYHPMPVHRVFTDSEQRERWLNKRARAQSAAFLSDPMPPESAPAGIRAPHGLITVQGTGWVDLRVLLAAFRAYLRERGMLLESRLGMEELRYGPEGVAWGALRARKVLFCNGYAACAQREFRYLPFDPTRGELLTLRIPGLNLREIYFGDVFLIPLGPELYRVGATYERDSFDTAPRAQSLAELKERLGRMLTLPWEAVQRDVGVRPNMQSHYPVAGLHPENGRIGLINGLGSKGVLLGPTVARLFADHLVKAAPLPREIDLAQFAARLNFIE